MMHKRVRWRRLMAGLLLALGVAPVAFYALLQTGPGRARLAEELSRVLSSGAHTVQVEQLRVVRLNRVEVGGIRAADRDGPWLAMRYIDLRWNPFALLFGRVEAERVRIGSVEMMRRPAPYGAAAPRRPSASRVPEFRVAGFTLGALRLDSALCGVPVAISGTRGRLQGGGYNGDTTLRLSVETDSVAVSTGLVERVAGDLEVRIGRSRVGLSGHLASGDGSRLACDLVFSDGGAWPKGDLQVEVDAAAPWVRVLCPGLAAGRLSAVLASAAGAGNRESLTVSLAADGIRGEAYAAGIGRVHAQVQRTSAQSDYSVEADGRLERVQFGELSVTGAQIHVSGPWRTVRLAGTAGGDFKKPFAVEVSGRLQWQDAQRGVELDSATLEWAGGRAHLEEPLVFEARGDQSIISAAWRMGPFDLASVSNATLGAIVGRVNAGLRVGGSLAAPVLEGDVSGEGLGRRADGNVPGLPPVDGTLSFQCSSSSLTVLAQARLPAGGHARVSVEAPVQVSLRPWVLRLDQARELSATLDAGFDLAALNGLEAFANGRVGGRIDLSVAHTGPFSGGSVTGTCVLAGGEFENYELGTVIREVGVRMVSRGDRLVIESGSATDGGKGRMTLAGQVGVDPAGGFPYAFEVGFDKARLLRRPDAVATLSGKLTVDGAVPHVRLDGDLVLDGAVLELRNLRPPAPSVLEPIPFAEPAAAAREGGGTNVTIRLAVAVPGTLYIRGRALDSAWAGRLVAGYEGGEASLTGALEARRGTVLLLKREFRLSEGQVEFDGRWPPDPSLRLVADHVRSDFSARVSIVGNLRNPAITLTSQPPLPEEEIIARILFGKEMSTVTPLQMLSMATEVAKLRKLAGGNGILYDIKSAIGIDRVEIREAGEGDAETEIAAGKYLGDHSYVEMRRSAWIGQPGRVQFYLEHELRPNIALEAVSGMEMRSGMGIFWRRDY